MKFKWIFLFFLLGLPVSVYLFLQGFGANKFEVPVFYQDGVKSPISDCQFGSGQYKVPVLSGFDSTLRLNPSKFTIIDIGSPNCDSCQYKINNLISILDKFRNWDELRITSILQKGSFELYSNSNKNWDLITSTKLDFQELANCVLNFGLEVDQNGNVLRNGIVVLLDDLRRIRGYYNIFDQEEADRLAVELEILKQNQQIRENGVK